MNEIEYLENALTTWEPEALVAKGFDPIEYLLLGLLGELGELPSHKKRIMRDGPQPDADWMAELGDCLWYAAVYSSHHKAPETHTVEHKPAVRCIFEVMQLSTALLYLHMVLFECKHYQTVDYIEAMIEGLGCHRGS